MTEHNLPAFIRADETNPRTFHLNPDAYLPGFYKEAAELAAEIAARTEGAQELHQADAFWREEAANLAAIAAGGAPDQYWIDCGMQCMKLDAMMACGLWRKVGRIKFVVTGEPGHKERWGPAGKAEGRGSLASSPGAPVDPSKPQGSKPHHARQVFIRLRGYMLH